MTRKFLLLVVLVAGFMTANFSAYQVYGQTTQDKQVKQQSVKYTCPVHPEVVKDMPGNCPKCKTKLVEKKEMAQGKMNPAKDSTMMKHDHSKMMHDSTMMKKGHMMHDSTMMNKQHMMHDTTSMKHEKMGM